MSEDCWGGDAVKCHKSEAPAILRNFYPFSPPSRDEKGGTIPLSGADAVESYSVAIPPWRVANCLDVKYHGLIGTNEITLVSPYPVSVFNANCLTKQRRVSCRRGAQEAAVTPAKARRKDRNCIPEARNSWSHHITSVVKSYHISRQIP